MIDDDFPPMAGQAPQQGRSVGQQELQQPQEAFPDLSTSLGAAGGTTDPARHPRSKRYLINNNNNINIKNNSNIMITTILTLTIIVKL